MILPFDIIFEIYKYTTIDEKIILYKIFGIKKKINYSK